MRKLHGRKSRGSISVTKIEKTSVRVSVRHCATWKLQVECDWNLDGRTFHSHVNRLHLARKKVEGEYEECG
jgi:hypothetical protein